MLKATLIGNIGSDPDMKYSPNGDGRLTFNVASNGRRRDQAGNWVDETTWVRCTVFGKRAETLSQHLRKGMRVYVDGRLEARPWKDRTDNPQAGLELVASDVEFVSPRQQEDDGYAHPANTVNAAARRQPVAAGASDDSDSLPF